MLLYILVFAYGAIIGAILATPTKDKSTDNSTVRIFTTRKTAIGELLEVGNRVHDIKIQPPYFDDVCCGNKTFEVRKNDRDYHVGDILNLQEYTNNSLSGLHYTGREYKARISYIMEDTDFCKDGYVILGIRPLEQ